MDAVINALHRLGAACGRVIAGPWVYAYVLAEVVLALAVSLLLRSSVALFALDPLLFFPVFAVHLYRRRSARLVALTSLWGIWKSLLFVGLIAMSGNGIDPLVSGAAAYHVDTLNWIVHNEGLIAHPEIFSWLHLEGLCRVTVSAVASSGLTTLVAGSRELNLMNFHVARLLGMARDVWPALGLAWPVWSLLRGWAYLFVMMGTAPLFVCILTRRRPAYRRLAPWFAAGVALAALDLGLKVLLAPAWRRLILSSLN